MTILQAIVLGIVQGLTEFLPVSSSAHLVITQHLFGLEGPILLVFDIVVHGGTLASLFVFFAKEFFPIPKIGLRMFWLIVLATIPTAFIGLLLKGWMEVSFNSLWITVVTLMMNSFILWSTRWVPGGDKKKMNGWLDAFWIGVAQGISILPGISRSGATIATGLWLRVKPEEATRFSFFISVPAIVGAMVFVLPETIRFISMEMRPVLIVGFVSAFISGYLAIAILFRIVSRGKFHYFAIYTMALALVACLFSLPR